MAESFLSGYPNINNSPVLQFTEISAAYPSATNTIPASSMIIPFAIYRTDLSGLATAFSTTNSPLIYPGKALTGALMTSDGTDQVTISFDANKTTVTAMSSSRGITSRIALILILD